LLHQFDSSVLQRAQRRVIGAGRLRHQLFSDFLVAKGQARDAIPHYREAIGMRPESVRARLGVGLALAAAGDFSGAVEHLKKASGGSDPSVREKAVGILRQRGRNS
jgi:hypothetical protein